MKTKSILFLFPIFSVGISCWYFSGNDTNHSGFNFLWWIWPLVFCAIVSASYAYKKSKLAILALVMNIIAILFFYYVDHFNYMVEYEEWLRRGMPEKLEMDSGYRKY